MGGDECHRERQAGEGLSLSLPSEMDGKKGEHFKVRCLRKVTGWHLLFSVTGCGERRLAVGQPEQAGRTGEEMAGVLSLQTSLLAVNMRVCICVCEQVCVFAAQACNCVGVCIYVRCVCVCVCVCVRTRSSFCVCATIKEAFPGSWQLCLAVVVPSFACCLATSKLIQTQIISQERRPGLCLMPATPHPHPLLHPSLKLQSPHKSPLCAKIAT